MLNIAEFFKKYDEGEFTLDLMAITLTQRAVGQPLVFRGKGIVSFAQGDDHFSLRMFADLPSTPDPDMPQWPAREATVVGEPIPEHHFFDFKATDLAGFEWHCDDIRIYPIAGRGVVLTSRLRSLTCVSSLRILTEQDHVTSYFFGGLELPFLQYVKTTVEVNGRQIGGGLSAAHHESQTGAFDFVASRVQKYGDICFVRVTPQSGALSASAESRVNEALSFCLGLSLDATITERWQGTQQIVTLKPLIPGSAGMFSPPVLPSMQFAEDFWRLFGAYFAYTVADAVGARPHSLSRQFQRVLAGSRVSHDLAALVATVAVEGLLKLDEFGDVPFPKADPDKTGQGAKSQCRKRKKPVVSPKNKLRTLNENRLVSQAMVDAWDDLRNSTAHGEMSTEKWREERFRQKCFSVSALLNRLVFLVIGYNGEHTDFSLPGWPNSYVQGANFEVLRIEWAKNTYKPVSLLVPPRKRG